MSIAIVTVWFLEVVLRSGVMADTGFKITLEPDGEERPSFFARTSSTMTCSGDSAVGASCDCGGDVDPGASLGENSPSEGHSVGLKNSMRLNLLGLRRALTMEHLSKRDLVFSGSVVLISDSSFFSPSSVSDFFFDLWKIKDLVRMLSRSGFVHLGLVFSFSASVS